MYRVRVIRIIGDNTLRPIREWQTIDCRPVCAYHLFRKQVRQRMFRAPWQFRAMRRRIRLPLKHWFDDRSKIQIFFSYYIFPPIKQSNIARYGSSYFRKTFSPKLSNIVQLPKESNVNQNKSFLPKTVLPRSFVKLVNSLFN